MAKIGTTVPIDLTAILWIQVADRMYNVGTITFDAVTTREGGVAEVVDAIAEAVPFIQPHLRQDITVEFSATVEL
jgi:hypothetical protein